jgi:phosphoribosylformylglycinamidine cyclo-ligase
VSSSDIPGSSRGVSPGTSPEEEGADVPARSGGDGGKPRARKPRRKPSSAESYARAGVDLDHDESFVDDIKEIAKSTFRPEILTGIGGFAGLFKAPERYSDPVFVASTDGVGTKLKLAAQVGRYDTIGIDCVAMVVNDLIVQGAEPVVFLDYLAMSQLDKATAIEALRGVAEGCKRAGCALLGGETATMPGVYKKGEVELVGFGVGVVDRDRVIDGSTIREDDKLIGLASSGFHSNGYSLVRKVLEEGLRTGKVDLFAEAEGMNTSLASALLAPTRIYVKPLLNVIREFEVHGIVHVTGGGFAGNVPRILPQGVRARIDPEVWPRPGVFGWLQKLAELPEGEMLRVFNCGIGMILVVPEEQAEDIIHRLQGLGERAYLIGEIERKPSDDEALLTFDPGYLEKPGPFEHPGSFAKS